MKNISLLSILTTLLLSFIVFAEENNPCLHSWGELQYDCNTSVSGASVSVKCNTSKSEAISKIKSASTKNGSCKKYKICTKCNERNNLGDNTFSDIICGTLNCSTDPSGHVEGSGNCEVSATCHTKRTSTGYVSAEGHKFYCKWNYAS